MAPAGLLENAQGWRHIIGQNEKQRLLGMPRGGARDCAVDSQLPLNQDWGRILKSNTTASRK